MKKTLLAGAFAFFLSACGGGGSGSTAPELMKITEDNADAVIATTVAATEVADLGFIGIPVPAAKSALEVAKYAKTVSVDEPSYLVAEDPNGICLYGGTSSIDGTTVTLTDCVVDEFGTTLNGQIKVLSTSSVQFIGLEIVQGELLAYFSSGTFTFDELSGDMSGTITGYVTVGIYRIDYDSFTMTAVEDSYTFDGFIYTECIGGWIEIETIQALIIPEDCPTQGEVAMIGDGSALNMVFGIAPSVTITLDGELYGIYPTCDDLPSIEEECLLLPI